MIGSVSRDDLQEMYEVGRIKYATLTRPNATKIMMEFLYMMFDPEREIETKPYTQVTMWKLFDHNGVHYVIKDSGRVEFYLVEKKYNHGLKMMKLMLAKKLSAAPGSSLASQLVRKIMNQINELESKKK